MAEITTIGVDIAKSVFQVHGVDGCGQVAVWRRLRRAEVAKFFACLPPCLVAMEACGTSHYWARQIGGLGHEVRLLPPAHVKPYVKPGKKNDASDAAAICEAVTRPHMRFVPVKTVHSQAVLMLHRTRDLLVRQRTIACPWHEQGLICALRGHRAELGLVAGQGKGNFTKLVACLDLAEGTELPELAQTALRLMAVHIDDADEKIRALEKTIVARHRADPISRRLASIPGVGPITASGIAAAVPDAAAFKSGRQFAAWLGLVPKQRSTGGKQRLGGITKAGDRSIRRLLVIGATGLIRYRRQNVPGGLVWLSRLLARKPVRLVTVALANKMARIVWAILCRGGLCRGGLYREAAAVAAA